MVVVVAVGLVTCSTATVVSGTSAWTVVGLTSPTVVLDDPSASASC